MIESLESFGYITKEVMVATWGSERLSLELQLQEITGAVEPQFELVHDPSNSCNTRCLSPSLFVEVWAAGNAIIFAAWPGLFFLCEGSRTDEEQGPERICFIARVS